MREIDCNVYWRYEYIVGKGYFENITEKFTQDPVYITTRKLFIHFSIHIIYITF